MEKSASADGANGPNRMSLAGLEAPPLTRSIAQMGHDSQNCTFYGELMMHVSNAFVRCNDTLWNAYERRQQRFSAKTAIF